ACADRRDGVATTAGGHCRLRRRTPSFLSRHMQRVLPASRSLPLFGVERTREIERRASASLPPHTLMRRAGLAVARLAIASAPHAGRVWVAAGPGNNGGDGLEAAFHLQAAGKRVQVSLVGDAARLPADTADALARA